VATPRCLTNPYSGVTSCRDYPLLHTFGMRYTIGETTLGTPEHDKGWLILVNMEEYAQNFLVELVVPWEWEPYYVFASLPPKGRASIELHEDPLFWDPVNNFVLRERAVFTTNIYFTGAGYAQTTVRPVRPDDEIDFSKEFINVGVVVPRLGQ
jgi:hypothetical protein